ncbi:formylglycine-generating enzyme family protein [Hymenobacter agri]
MVPTNRAPQQPFAFDTYPRGFDETLVFRFAPCSDSSAQAFRRIPALPKILRSQWLVTGPGTIFIASKNIELDEVEISNREWQHFLNCLAADSSQAVYNTFLPSPAAQPVADYFTNPFYQYFPVVGISYAQATGFCRWRGQKVTATFNSRITAPAKRQRFTYRLPTEQEWESAAGNFISRDYGTPCTSVRIEVNPKAAAYLQQRARSTVPVAQIARDIIRFNAAKSELVWFVCQRELPYFLRSPTPDYVYSTAPNSFGLYHMIGNVAEMVQEQGIAKGGSYRDPLAACTIASRSRFDGPAPNVGFRCVGEVALLE